MKSIKLILLLCISVFLLHARQILGAPDQGGMDSSKTVADEKWQPVFSRRRILNFARDMFWKLLLPLILGNHYMVLFSSIMKGASICRSSE